GCVANWEGGFNVPKLDQWEKLKEILSLPDDMDAEVWRLNGRKGMPGEAWEKREVVGEKAVTRVMRGSGDLVGGAVRAGIVDITAPATDAAKQWDGWGTALKPAIEPIILARKPLDGTVANNVLAHGVGGLNIDACRVATEDDLNGGGYSKSSTKDAGDASSYFIKGAIGEFVQPAGR